MGFFIFQKYCGHVKLHPNDLKFIFDLIINALFKTESNEQMRKL